MQVTWGFWLTIGFAVPTLVLGSDVTTSWSLSIGAPMIDCLSTNELDTGRQTQVNILTKEVLIALNPSDNISGALMC